jgi:hypothetical protein
MRRGPTTTGIPWLYQGMYRVGGHMGDPSDGTPNVKKVHNWITKNR